ncbi:hypothetical protein IQ244_13590 [Nostoc sp. LEGE 06077]|uniref:beta strand repeat-containing protein n=1 Tax=Nostoc sp. LEGE 06077 TaxID=915325 RepID=UPI00187EE345|nr:choice-of-anchor Q domain-containing protein [Nostoc sp. LEGE 06077]MBE9207539.1 hypothetical protein [Nostoc sp. LEGE 06077]
MATFNVTNTKNSGLGSLQQAILNANTSAGKDLIRFTGGLFTDNIADTISLGGSSLFITDDLSIDGRGSNLLTISGNYNPTKNNKTSRVFEIGSGITVEIEGLKIANGYAKDTKGGGGIYNSGNLKLNNVTISNNFSGGQNSTVNNGGGIYNSNTGVLTLNNSTITGNYSVRVDSSSGFYTGNGGGIYNRGIVTLNSSTINANSAGYYDNHYFEDYSYPKPDIGRGAGIYTTGTVTANNSTINNNRGSYDGTGIYNTGTVTLNDSSVDYNVTYDGFSGIVSNGNLTIRNSSVSSNSVVRVGGASSGIDSTGTLIISNSHIDNNYSSWVGGVLHSGILTVTNSSINNNSGRSLGGLSANGTVTIDNTTINDNSSYYEFSVAGLSIRGGTANVSNSIISDNYSSDGSAGLGNSGNVILSNSTISANQGDYSIYQEVKVNQNGSAIRNTASGNLTVINSTITNNSEADGTIVNYGTVNIISSTISGNQSIGILNHGTVTVVNSTLSENLNSGFFNYGNGIVFNSTINNNLGTGVYNSETGTITLVNSTISGNQSRSQGGGIYNSGTLNVSNSTIALNTAYTYEIDYYYNDFGQLVYYKTDNYPPEYYQVFRGAGIYNAETGTATIKNSIIAGNNDGISDAVNPDVVGNFISNGYNLIGNRDGSTGFNASEQLRVSISEVIDTVLRDNGGAVKTHALVYGSPAINGGNNADIPADIADLDRDGNTTEGIPFDQRGRGYRRILNGRVDIGAYEASVINGTAYPNNLRGTAINDLIAGLRGADVLTGGAGADNFVYTSLADSGDTITDFAVGTDKIVLQALWRSLDLSNLNFATAIAGGYLQLQTAGTDTSVLIDLDGTAGQRVALELVRLRNVSADALNDSKNFVF